jgi:hypothetical protein
MKHWITMAIACVTLLWAVAEVNAYTDTNKTIKLTLDATTVCLGTPSTGTATLIGDGAADTKVEVKASQNSKAFASDSAKRTIKFSLPTDKASAGTATVTASAPGDPGFGSKQLPVTLVEIKIAPVVSPFELWYFEGLAPANYPVRAELKVAMTPKLVSSFT